MGFGPTGRSKGCSGGCGASAASIAKNPTHITQNYARSIVAAIAAFLLAASLFPAQALAIGEASSMTERIAATAPAGNNQYVTGGVVFRGVDNQPGDVAVVGFDDELQATQGDGEDSEPQDSESPTTEPQATEPQATEPQATQAADSQAADPAEAGPASSQTSITIPASIRTAKGECRVVGIAFDEGQAAPGITALKVGANVEEVMTGTLGRALPSLASITVDPDNKAYSSKQGVLLRGDELVYAPAAAVAVSVPAGCKSIAPGAFRDAAGLRTVVVWGPLDSIAGEAGSEGDAQQSAFTDEQKASVRVAMASSGAAVAADEGAERVAATAALAPMGDVDCSGVWRDCQFASDNIMDAAPAGTTSDAVENGLVYTMQADGTLAASWAGDKTATPASLDIPATAEVAGTAYAVSTVAEGALRDASFLASASVAEGVTAIGKSAFEGCVNLKAVSLPSTLRTVDYAAFEGTSLEETELPKGVVVGGANETLTQSAQGADAATDQSEATSDDEEVPYANNRFAYATLNVQVPQKLTFAEPDGYLGDGTDCITTGQIFNQSDVPVKVVKVQTINNYGANRDWFIGMNDDLDEIYRIQIGDTVVGAPLETGIGSTSGVEINSVIDSYDFAFIRVTLLTSKYEPNLPRLKAYTASSSSDSVLLGSIRYVVAAA